MTYKKTDSEFGDFKITERNVNGFSDLNLQKNSSYSNEAFSMDGEKEEFNKMKLGNEEFDNILMIMNHQKMEKRDFFAEIRAQLDLDHYLDDIVIQFKEDQYSYSTILKNLSEEMLKKEGIKYDFSDIRSNFFIEQMEIDLTNKVQSAYMDVKGYNRYDENWVCAMGTMSKLKRKKIGLAILANKTNLGPNASEVQFVLLILSPKREKVTKNSYETARTFATLFTNKKFRERLIQSKDRQGAICLIEEYWTMLTNECKANQKQNYKNEYFDSKTYLSPGLGLVRDINKRYSLYASDYLDGFRGDRTILKLLATTLFLFFSIILPAIAFGVLNSNNTKGKIDVSRALIGQAIGGLFFAIFSGQHMIVLGTTALVSLYTKVIYELSLQLDSDFHAMYACCGLFSSLFVFIYSFFGISYIIKYCTRSVEEMFAVFITICFTVDAIRDTINNVNQYYHSPACYNQTLINTTINGILVKACEPENTLCSLLLMLGTVWLSLRIYNFNRSQFLTEKQRDIISTYALPISVLVFTAISLYVFKGINVERFEFKANSGLERAKLETLSLNSIFVCAGLGFALSILFFMDQNITGQIVNSPTNNLKKGPAPHLDLFVLGILNGFLAVFALPYMHGILPQSPLHVVMMADQEEKLVENHYERQITKVRETRLTSILCNILILISFYLIPEQIKLIPVPVLDGLFLYCAVASLRGNSLFERILLLFTEQANYPPKFYIRRCAQKELHIFTFLQFLQLIVVTIVGYHSSAYVQMAFPVVIALLIPFRYTIVPLFIKKKYLAALEAYD